MFMAILPPTSAGLGAEVQHADAVRAQDAQRVFANAEQALATEQTNYATLIAGLFRALGVQS